jgi:hypothetical protein
VSREELTAMKRALVVYGGLVTLLPIVSIGWFARDMLDRVEKRTFAAISTVEASVGVVKTEQAKLDARVDGVEYRVSRVENWIDGRRLPDALPERRRRTAMPAAVTIPPMP